MNENYNETSWTKGKKFEDFIEAKIFPKSHYEVSKKTHDYNQNSERFVTSSLEPDFQFRCRLTGRNFRVEAKFRSNPYRNTYDILSDQQFKSFPDIYSNECPIYIAFGYGGDAANPDYLSLIPFNDITSRTLSPEEVFHYKIEKELYPPHKIEEDSSKESPEDHLTEDQSKEFEDNFGKETKENRQGEKKPETINGLKKYNSNILGLAAIGVLTIIMTIYGFAFSEGSSDNTPEEQLKEIVADYYQSMNSNQIEKLPSFLSPQVTSWYGEQNPTKEWIYRNAKAHRGKYPYSSSDIDWNSFKVIPAEAGGYRVTYEMIYRSKEKITDDYTVYNLKLLTQWDDDFKLKSITEIRN